MFYFFIIAILIALHIPIYRRETKRYIIIFLSLFLIVVTHVVFIYSLTPDYWINISDKVSFNGPSNYYYMSVLELFFYAFIVVWLSISMQVLSEFVLDKFEKRYIKSKTIRLVNSVIIAVISIYFLIYGYFVDEFINSVNSPGLEFVQHYYLFFIDIVLFVLVIELIRYKK